MKKTTRVLSLALCLAMLIGVFASSVSAVEPTFIINEDFTDLVKDVETNTWASPFVHIPVEEQEEEEVFIEPTNVMVLTGAKDEAKHEARLEYSFGADLATSQLAWDNSTPDGTGENEGKFTSNDSRWYARNKFWGIEYKFDAKIDGADMGITMYQSFYGINNAYTPANQTGRYGNLLITADGKIYKALDDEPDEEKLVGQIDTTQIDLSQWHTYTCRWVRTSAYSGDYYLWLYIDGEFIPYNEGVTVKSSNGGVKDYFTVKVHNSEGSVAVDNISATQAVYNINGTAEGDTPAGIVATKTKEIMTEDFTTGTYGEGWFLSLSTDATGEVVESLNPGAGASTNSQHVKINHAAADGQRAYIGYVLADDVSNFVYEYSKISTKDLTFEAKITDGATMRIEFYIVWDLYKYNGDTEATGRYVSVDIASDGTVTNASRSVAMGTVPSTVDMSQWHTYTLRCSRKEGGSGSYDVQLLIDGVAVAYTGDSFMQGQGSPQYDRFAIHARSAGSIEIDNIKIDELYLDERMGAVTSGSVNTIWSYGFDDPTTMTYHEGDGYTKGAWKKAAHAGTEVTFVTDAVDEEPEEEPAPKLPGENGGYLQVNNSTSMGGYLVRLYDTGNTPLDAGATFWFAADICVEGGGVSMEIGCQTNNGSGRKAYLIVKADGVYYKDNEGDYKLCNLPNNEWNHYMVKVEPVDAGKATLYINGVQKAEFGLYNITFNATSDNFYALKFSTSKDWGLTGTAKVDNLKVTTGAAPAATGDASLIVAAAMMLPVSGIGLGALCLKRKKEN